jgi:hypothetical protein
VFRFKQQERSVASVRDRKGDRHTGTLESLMWWEGNTVRHTHTGRRGGRERCKHSNTCKERRAEHQWQTQVRA